MDTDKLVDWREKLNVRGSDEENLKSPMKLDEENLKSPMKREVEQNNNELEKATLVNVNNTDIALFKYGDTIIGGFEIYLMQ